MKELDKIINSINFDGMSDNTIQVTLHSNNAINGFTLFQPVIGYNGVKLPSGLVANTSYNNQLSILEQSKFHIYRILIQSDYLPILRNPLQLIKYNINGEIQSKTALPVKNTYQNQTDIVEMKTDFWLDGKTGIEFGYLEKLKNIYITLYFDKEMQPTMVKNFSNEYMQQYFSIDAEGDSQIIKINITSKNTL